MRGRVDAQSFDFLSELFPLRFVVLVVFLGDEGGGMVLEHDWVLVDLFELWDFKFRRTLWTFGVARSFEVGVALFGCVIGLGFLRYGCGFDHWM